VSANWFPRSLSGSNSWELRDISSVDQTFHATYSVVNAVTADFGSSYTIAISGTWATIEINGAISLVVERLFPAQYSVITSVSADFPALYFLDGVPPTPPLPVFQDFTLVYGVDSTPTASAVSQDYPVIWSAAGVVIADFSPLYTVARGTTSPEWDGVDSQQDGWTAITTGGSVWTGIQQSTGTWN
jgi:hypothetical protein